MVAYCLLATEPFTDEAIRFRRAVGQAFAPAHWEAELANVLWMAIRTGVLPTKEGHRQLDFATRLSIRSVPIQALWQAALARSLASGVSVYDTLFVELAARQRLPLATFDAHILKMFPDVAQRPSSLLSN